MKQRKAFSFYRSYFEIVNELPQDQKLPFIMAILNKQFLDIEPQLNGLANLLYKSQKHAIDAQVNGYKSKMGITTEGPCQPPTEANNKNNVIATQAPYQTPSVQEKEKEKGKEKEEEQVEGEEYQKNYKFIKYNKLKGEYEFDILTKLQKDKLQSTEILVYENELNLYNKNYLKYE